MALFPAFAGLSNTKAEIAPKGKTHKCLFMFSGCVSHRSVTAFQREI